MNINNKLITFAQQELALSATERTNITASLTHLEKVLKDKLGHQIKEFILFGSYTRGTMLPRKYDPQSDIDVMIVFNDSVNKQTPGQYRRYLIEVLTQTYPNSNSVKDFPVVKLELNHIMFDLVPAYTKNPYGSLRNYYIPDKNDIWKSTVPNDINDLLTVKNQVSKNAVLTNVIRLCKYWNAKAKYPFESYDMERKIISGYPANQDNTYDTFLKTINTLTIGRNPEVRQVLNYIQQYRGNYLNSNTEEMQLQWLQKLLPELK